MIKAAIQILEAKLRAEGKMTAKNIEIQGKGYANLKIAEQMAKVADKNAEVTKIEG